MFLNRSKDVFAMTKKIIKRAFTNKLLLLSLSVVFFLCLPKTARAADLPGAKDTISTSRPSAAAPLAADLPANSSLFTFDDNGSKYLASDSAKFFPDTGETLETQTVASSSSNTVYLATKTTSSHHKGSVVMVPVTATHTISFTTASLVPSNGLIKVIFPVGNTTNAASPSASGFSFNGLSSNNLSISGATCGSWTITPASGLVQCNLNVAITAPTAITITIGAGTSGPVLINPTKSATAGTADVWAIQLQTTENSGAVIDSTRVRVGTIESVNVYATVDPTLTFVIQGINAGSSVNFGNNVGCGDTEPINTGINSTATDVNLGLLNSTKVSISAQLITVSTNGYSGYVLTATSSGHLIDPAIGYWIPDAQNTPTANDTPAPVVLTAGTPAFGIHPCGLDVNGSTWGTGPTGGGAGAKYANPSPTYYYTLASDSTGPVGNAITPGNGLTSIAYAATVSIVVPAGNYRTAITYVATPSF